MRSRKKVKPLKRITVTVYSDDNETPDQLTGRSDVSASWLIRRTMRVFLQRYRDDRRIYVTLDPNVD